MDTADSRATRPVSPGRFARLGLGWRALLLPALSVVLPALAWLALEGRVYPPFEPFMTGDYAKIELYTRLAAEGSQYLGTESRFHIHHLGPAFFYFAVPFYELCGETTRGMAVAALAWNVLFLVALLRGAERLSPRTGPFVAAILLFVFLEARGVGWMLSSWNPHLAMLPFGVALVAAARLSTGEWRALPVLALAGSVVLQGHMVWAPPLALAGAVGLLLCAWPALRKWLGVPSAARSGGAPTLRDGSTRTGDGVSGPASRGSAPEDGASDPAPRPTALEDGASDPAPRPAPARDIGRAFAAAIAVAVVLWALPVYDEITGSYKNFRRILTMGTEAYDSRPWSDSLGPCLRALELRRDGQAPGASFEWGARNVGVDPRVGTDADPIAGGTGFGPREVLRAVALAAALAACYVLGSRRRAGTAALALVALLAAATLPVVALRSPGRELPWYLLQWGAMVTLVALLAVGVELVERAPRLARLVAGGAGKALLLALSALLLASAVRNQGQVGPRGRNPRAMVVERLTAAVKERAKAEVGRHRFLLRVAPHEDQALAVGLVLALDKARVPFAVEPFGSCRIEGRFTPKGDEWAELLVGNLEARPGAVRLDARDGVSVAWQMKPPPTR